MTETIYTVLLGTWTDVEGMTEARCGCEWARVELTAERALNLLKDVCWFRSLAKLRPDLRDIRFVDQSADWFEEPAEPIQALNTSGVADEMDLVDTDWVVLRGKYTIPEEDYGAHDPEGARIVDDEGVSWMTWVKGSDLRVYTYRLPAEELEKIAAGYPKTEAGARRVS